MTTELGDSNKTESLSTLNSIEYENAPELVARAYKFGKNAHGTQTRYDGVTPYFDFHCVGVDKIVHKEWKIDDPVIRAMCLLHDTVEDTAITLEDLKKEFGERLAFGVDSATKFTLVQNAKYTLSNEELDKKTIVKMYDSNLNNPAIVLPKIGDRLFNIRDLETVPDPEKRRKKAEETLNNYAPLAESLGLWRVKCEFENRCLAYTNPKAFKYYTKIISEDPRTQEEFVAWLTSTLEAVARDASIEARVETRMISLPKLENKKGKDLTKKINDLISFRVIVKDLGNVETRNEVYKMLGAIRQNFAEIEDSKRFDDFYFKPRDNDYSAIQLTLEFPQGSTEIAITSNDKEEFNNWGIVSLIRKGETDLSKHALKLVFTETQEVKFFPPKATGLDFAYSISQEMGARAVSVFINGVRYPVSTVLPNGSEVKIELGEPRIAPKIELKNYCLPVARKIIDEQLSEEAKGKLGMKGKEMIEKVISERGLIDLADLLKIDKHKPNLEHLLFILGCKNSIPDLYYKVGSGVMDINNLEKHFDEAGITKKELGLTSIFIEGLDGPGINSLVSSEVTALGGNIGPMENRPHDNPEGATFTIRMVVENLTKLGEEKLSESLKSDKRITKTIIV